MKQSPIKSAGISILMVLFAASGVAAQDTRLQEQAAPPPLKIISRPDRLRIDEEKEPKSRVRLTLELAETHLASAESETTRLNYDAAAAESGKYSALIEDVFVFLSKLKQDTNKTRDLYKRVELALRAHGPRLSIMRRTTPAAYAIWIKETEDFARRGRTEALNSFYGQTVIRDRTPTKSGSGTVQNNAAPPEKKP